MSHARAGIILFAAGVLIAAIGAESGPAHSGPPGIYAITGARLIARPGAVVEDATIVIRDGLIEAAGRGVTAPADAFVIEAAGRTVTAGFIDACTDIGQKKAEAPAESGSPRPGPRETPPGPVHPIARVRAERRAIDALIADDAAFDKHRALAFTSALTLPQGGVFRGQAALINLGGGPPSRNIVTAQAGQVIAFERGGFGQGYPTSLMGAIATVRQTLLDARRHELWRTRYASDPAGLPRPDHVAAFEALGPSASGGSRVIFDVTESADTARALAVAAEFRLDAILIGSGFEHIERGALAELRASGHPAILPLAFPEKPKVDDPDAALGVSLRELERWDQAPAAPARFVEAGVPIALGTCRLSTAAEFPARLRKAIGRGLSPDAALAALTSEPARMLGVDRIVGTVEAGKIANLVVFDGVPVGGEGIFSEKAKPVHVFVDGVKHDIEQKKSKGDPNARVDPRGTWSVTFSFGSRDVTRVWTI
ncbi:MAG TPA: amidohydrolase family protein, partial [Candidatus Polarisedimenticolia bacterium]|nr:amidohydrolase family protein [Candidatus Polarisedimenticolia bacterium]